MTRRRILAAYLMPNRALAMSKFVTSAWQFTALRRALSLGSVMLLLPAVSGADSCSAVFSDGRQDKASTFSDAARDEELANRTTPFANGDVDLSRYVADRSVIDAYRRNLDQKQFGHYAQNRFLRTILPYIFGSRGNETGMTPEEARIIDEYVLTGPQQPHYLWTAALWQKNTSQIAKYEMEIRLLASALNKIPGYTGTAYREVQLPDDVIARYRKNVGRIVFERSFSSSSSVKRDTDFTFSNVYFEYRLKGRAGKPINWDKTLESEVLINANTAFKVVSVEVKSRRGYDGKPHLFSHIIMEEISADRQRVGAGQTSRSVTPQVTPQVTLAKRSETMASASFYNVHQRYTLSESGLATMTSSSGAVQTGVNIWRKAK